VVVERGGKAVYDGFVEIEAGHEAQVTLGGGSKPVAAATADAGGDDAPAELHDAPAEVARPRTAPMVHAAGAMDIGFRQFSYQHNTTPATQRDNREVGQVLAGPVIEVWPAAIANLDFLRGLSVYGRFEFGVNAQAVAVVGANGVRAPSTLTTAWRSLETSVHQRWMVTDVIALEVGGGYAQDHYQFKGAAKDIDIVPNAAYSMVRIGGKASLMLGMIEPYLAGEERIVLSGGALDDRYKLGASANGVRGELGAVVHLGHGIDATLAGIYSLYAWTFKPDVNDPRQATGGSDAVENVTLAVGYAY
jgi:hypothetical protein